MINRLNFYTLLKVALTYSFASGFLSSCPGRNQCNVCHKRRNAIFMKIQNYYDILGVVKTASDSEIKRAYRRAALKNHPDVNPAPDAEKQFRDICKAYEVLSDKDQRAKYDRKVGTGSKNPAYGSSSYSSTQRSSSQQNSAYSTRSRQQRPAEPTPDEIDDSFTSIFSDFLNGLAGGSGGFLDDLVSFMESKVDGFSSETTSEFEDLLSSTNFNEIRLEIENTEFLLRSLKPKRTETNRKLSLAEAEVLSFKKENKIANDVSILDKEMELIERAAGLKARSEEVEAHIKRAEKRLRRLQQRQEELERTKERTSEQDIFQSEQTKRTSVYQQNSSKGKASGSTVSSKSLKNSETINSELKKLKQKLGKMK